MSWVYCEPKSRTRIFSPWMSIALLPPHPALSPGGGEGEPPRRLVDPVVRRFLRDDHVVDVALAQAGGGDADELRLGAKLADVPAADVAHPAPEPAHELEEDHPDRSLVGHAPLDPLGDELVGVLDVGLEVAVLRPLLHRADGAHAPVGLVAAPLVEDHLARRLL